MLSSLNSPYYIIVGKFHDRWAGGNVGVALTAALPNYHNLQSLTLLGHKYQKNILPVIFANIHRAAALIHLTIASNCIEEESDFSLLDQLLSVRSLTILSPKNVILLPLPAWLEKLPQPLKELRLEDNCGSVTPGTLKFLIPHLPDLEVFTLGLSYSVKDEDLFPFLGKLTRLRQLQLTYYIQLGALPKVTISPSLVSFEVRYKMIHSRPHTNSLCTWVHQIIAHTSLESLELLCEDAEEYEGSGAHPSFDGLVKHLSVRHAKTLKTLRMEDAFVGTPAMVDLMSNCRQLEHLAVSVRENFIPQCTTFLPSMPRLRTIDIRIVNAKPQKVLFSIEQAQNFLRDGTSNLRQITVNGHGWKGEWCVQWDGDRPSAAFKLTEIQD
ncbi:hypothetical protein BD410DRAFT_481672 [Rickenella mellea]|uniref:RNI-like protein n=1 Tax=Rickenella mellea TaxID=50990 RepID=A0A4Y7QIE4_9AGAM|nr:hypothetical protein BD410DRAFT_481672 [Rickenella mellea]